MFDGKVVNALTDTSSTQSCNVCGAKPSEMNNLKVIRQKKPNQEALALGISSLHCLLRTFEFILHLGYKMDIKKFRKSCSEDQISIETRKRSIQSRYKEEMSLVVDQPKQGFGNTNDGNTARKAFDHAEMFADITGVDLDIIISLRTILKAISSGYEIEREAFKLYCMETADKIISLYGWYTLPPTVHKLLEHSTQVSDSLILPIGFYSEEDQEAQNKEIRKARLDHTAKISRVNVMKNQFHFLLTRSDPVISSISFVKHKTDNGNPLAPEVLALLKS